MWHTFLIGNTPLCCYPHAPEVADWKTLSGSLPSRGSYYKGFAFKLFWSVWVIVLMSLRNVRNIFTDDINATLYRLLTITIWHLSLCLCLNWGVRLASPPTNKFGMLLWLQLDMCRCRIPQPVLSRLAGSFLEEQGFSKCGLGAPRRSLSGSLSGGQQGQNVFIITLKSYFPFVLSWESRGIFQKLGKVMMMSFLWQPLQWSA